MLHCTITVTVELQAARKVSIDHFVDGGYSVELVHATHLHPERCEVQLQPYDT